MFATFPAENGLFSIILDEVEYETEGKTISIQLPIEYRERIIKQLCEKYGVAECDECGAISSDVEPMPTASAWHAGDPVYEARDLCHMCRCKAEENDDHDIGLQFTRAEEYQEQNN